MTMPEIKPKLDDRGEPRCDRGCPRYFPEGRVPVVGGVCLVALLDHLCVPGLQQQRDEAMRQRCVADLLLSGIEFDHDPLGQRRDIARAFYGPAVAERLFSEEEG